MPGINMQEAMQGLIQNTEFQAAIQNLAKLPKSVQALVNQGPTTEKYMTDVGANLLISDKLAEAGKAGEIMKLRYGLSLQGANNALALKKAGLDKDKAINSLGNRASEIGTLTGIANVGLSGYGAYSNAQSANALLDYYLKNKTIKTNPVLKNNLFYAPNAN
jgi:hypothetical protein